MAEFNIRTDAVDVEQIMRQIRARIQDKRGVDYTEQQIQELATVKLERFLDPKGVRSDLVEQFRARNRKADPFEPQRYTVDANDLYGSSRGPIRIIRKLLNPILKLFLNANRLVQVLHQQSEINSIFEGQFHRLRERNQQRDEVDALQYELVHNLVLELTRVGIENRNLKMRLESLSSRLDFDERRARALEGVVQYRPGTGPSHDPPPRPQPPPPPAPSMRPQPGAASEPATGTEEQAGESSTARRRRRRRRGRRGGRGRLPNEMTGTAAGTPVDSPENAVSNEGHPAAESAAGLEHSGVESSQGHPAEEGDDADDSDGDEGPEPSMQ